MAKNLPKGAGRRGAVKRRSQVKNTKTGRWVKRDKAMGQFMDQKSDGEPFKCVRREQ